MASATTTKNSASPPLPTQSPESGMAQATIRTTEQSGIHYNSIYLHTVPGTLKAVCLIFVLLGFICIQCSQYSGIAIAQFFSTTAMIAFWFTGILLVLYLFHVVYVFNKIPWTKIEFYFCLIIALCLMLASSLVAARGAGFLTAAAFFGFVAMCAYGYDAFLKYRLYNTITTVVTRTTTVTVA